MKRFYDAFESITPDSYDSLIEEVKNRNENVHIEPLRKKKKYRYAFLLTTICVVVISFIVFHNQNQVLATVGIDVNPSLALDIDHKQRIVKVIANNDDAKKIIGDMKLEGSDIEVGVNALIGSMLKEGYIDELKNSLLISVVGDHPRENEKLRQTLSLHIDEYLKASDVQGAIVSQTIDEQNQLNQLAKQYNISIGKAEIIQQLIQKNNLYTFEQLKDLSMNDLNILLHNNHIDVHMSGTVSEEQYIGKEKAKEIACLDANVSQPIFKKVELDFEHGQMIYEVEFSKNNQEYEYDIDALTGKILKKENENQTSNHHNHHNSSSSSISESQAKTIALQHAHVKTTENYQCKKDIDDNQIEYEIEFTSDHCHYEYTINQQGQILENKKKELPSSQITSEEAKQKAISHAGFSTSQVHDIDVDFKNQYYEVSFTKDHIEYEYKIDATNGTILKHHKEIDD